MNHSPSYTMRQLTKEFGVTARTLRYYENRKLVVPSRKGQARLYSAKDRTRILIVLRGRRLGFSIAQISDELRMYDRKDSSVRNELLIARREFRNHIAVLRCKLRDLNQSLQELDDGVREIDRALEGKPRRTWHEVFANEVENNGAAL